MVPAGKGMAGGPGYVRLTSDQTRRNRADLTPAYPSPEQENIP